MTEQKVSEDHARVREAIQLTRDEHYEEALELFEKHLPRVAGGDIAAKRLAASAFSFFGLCVAMVNRKYAQAVEYCNISLKANFLDPDHRHNLALVYLERNDRKRAVETLNAGLRLQPDNTAINVVFDRIGRRRPPVLPFLSRDNSLNVWLGRLRAKNQPPRKTRRRRRR
jgi:tetratricopeptide (TPR) repeat protein